MKCFAAWGRWEDGEGVGLKILKSFKEMQESVVEEGIILAKTVSLLFCFAANKKSHNPNEYERLYEITMKFQHWIRFDCLFFFFSVFSAIINGFLIDVSGSNMIGYWMKTFASVSSLIKPVILPRVLSFWLEKYHLLTQNVILPAVCVKVSLPGIQTQYPLI